MPQVAVPADFFAGELRVYGDWRGAFSRELLQNATDAEPSRIDVSFADVDGHGRVTFRDDGCGMSRQVLEEVFFQLGRTTKTGEGSIGGFGRARIFICFAQHRYTIRTGNLLVEGVGGEYTITELPDHQRGCEFVIDLLDPTCERVERAFRALLASSAIDVPVYINGTRVGTETRPARAARVLRDKDGSAWGRVYVLGDGYGQVRVRVHGLTMFTRWVEGTDVVVLELEPRRSREVLSASRDTLHADFAEQLDRFVADLVGNRRRALRPREEPLDEHILGGGFLISDAAATSAGSAGSSDQSSDAAADGPHVGTGTGTMAAAYAATHGRVGTAVRPANDAARANLGSSAAGAPVTDPFLPPPSGIGFDVFLLSDTNDARVRRLVRQWNPARWDARTGARRRALLLTWQAAVACALDELLALRPGLGRIRWTVGWTFDLDVEALHRGAGDAHVFALNPVTADGTTRYALSTRDARRHLLALAAHEVAHVVSSAHDEQFASVLTDLYAALDPAAADRRMREAATPPR